MLEDPLLDYEDWKTENLQQYNDPIGAAMTLPTWLLMTSVSTQ